MTADGPYCPVRECEKRMNFRLRLSADERLIMVNNQEIGGAANDRMSDDKIGLSPV